jgi:glutamyl-tRNA reductase
VATAAAAAVVLAGPLGAARARCATTDLPLLLLDLAVPRNVDPALARAPGVTVVDIDALRPAVTAGERGRSAAVPQAERIVEEELAEFSDWMREAAARDAIRPLCRALEAVCRREVAYALRGTTAAPQAADRAAERAAQRVAAKLLAGPMAELRGATARGESVESLAAALSRLFPGDVATPVPAPPADALPGVRLDLRAPYAAGRGLAC